ncbi:hypothetical protein ACJJTC_008563 [Scirpophaga incertulas]
MLFLASAYTYGDKTQCRACEPRGRSDASAYVGADERRATETITNYSPILLRGECGRPLTTARRPCNYRGGHGTRSLGYEYWQRMEENLNKTEQNKNNLNSIPPLSGEEPQHQDKTADQQLFSWV